MRDAAQLVGLRFACLRARHPEGKHRALYESSYRLWHKLWSPAYRQIGHGETIYSDTFLRHVEVAALFHHDEPIAVLLFDAFDLTNSVDLEHSYFKHFAPETLASLKSMRFRNVMAMGNLAVTHRWRGRDAAIAELLIGLCVLRFVHSQFDAGIAYSRNSKGTQHMSYRCGAEAVLSNGEAFGEPADFIVFDVNSQDVLNKHPRRALMQSLWDRRIQEESYHPLFINLNRDRVREYVQSSQRPGENHEQHIDADR